MEKNIRLILLLVFLVFIFGCSSQLPKGKIMETGEVVKPPAGYSEMQKRKSDDI